MEIRNASCSRGGVGRSPRSHARTSQSSQTGLVMARCGVGPSRGGGQILPTPAGPWLLRGAQQPRGRIAHQPTACHSCGVRVTRDSHSFRGVTPPAVTTGGHHGILIDAASRKQAPTPEQCTLRGRFLPPVPGPRYPPGIPPVSPRMPPGCQTPGLRGRLTPELRAPGSGLGTKDQAEKASRVKATSPSGRASPRPTGFVLETNARIAPIRQQTK